MSDRERVAKMQELNWKPAAQYWYEQYKLKVAEIEALKAEIRELQNEVSQ